MNDTHRPGDDMGQEELDLYVDGLLDDERRAAFERKLFSDPELAAELERQRSLEARLTAAFPVPENPLAADPVHEGPVPGDSVHEHSVPADSMPEDFVPADSAPITQSGGQPRIAGGRWFAWLRVAVAASLLAALGLWAMRVFDPVDEEPALVVDTGGSAPAGDGPADINGPGDLLQLVGPPGPAVPEGSCVAFGGLYAELADEGRQAAAVCGLPHDLARHFEDSLGQELVVDATDELPIEGPFSCRRFPTSTLLVSPQEPEPILILVDELARDPQPVLEADSPANLFRRELGDLVLYEFTPSDTPQALELFHLR